MRAGLHTGLLIASMALFAGGCGGGAPQWQTTRIEDVMPNLEFTLTDENGNTVHADEYRGKIKLLYFGYARCPDVCPLTLVRIRRALDELGTQADAARVLFVSVDPKRDSPDVLESYTQAFGPRFIGLTGTQHQLEALCKRYRVSFSYEQPDAHGNYVVNHSAAIFVFDRDGAVQLLMDRETTPGAMAHDLRQLVNVP